MNKIAPVFEDICKAHDLIKPLIHRTPVMTSRLINNIVEAELFFKCENFQKAGAFKFRGASHAIALLTKEEASRGVATHSSGNHAGALALAAANKGIKAYIVMPETAPQVKIDAVKAYGAEITFCKPTLEAREETLKLVVERTGATFIHPYDNSRIIAGQGTACKELLEEYPNLEIIMAPVGGGGLLSGTAISAKSMKPEIKVIAGEPKGADDAFRSFYSDKLFPSVNPKTIADGLLTSLSQLTLSIIRKNVDDILTVTEESIKQAQKLIMERMKILVEPSSAVPLAAIMENREIFSGRKVGIIVSGGNF
ncbi:MAG: pyridoxal-phosphate dependent enzyme [Bacteroidales bacterium]|nr:pyridoxal-phosphate dependent enzyme [Bacteroidales bacterium]